MQCVPCCVSQVVCVMLCVPRCVCHAVCTTLCVPCSVAMLCVPSNVCHAQVKVGYFPIRKLAAGCSHAQLHPLSSNLPCSLVCFPRWTVGFFEGSERTWLLSVSSSGVPRPAEDQLWVSTLLPLICIPVAGSAWVFAIWVLSSALSLSH